MKYGQIPFPAVSFCNINPFSLDKLSEDALHHMYFAQAHYPLSYDKGNVHVVQLLIALRIQFQK